MIDRDDVPTLEGAWLAELMRKGKKIKLWTCNGYQMVGVIEDYDENVVILRTKDELRMIWRHNLSTIVLEGGDAEK